MNLVAACLTANYGKQVDNSDCNGGPPNLVLANALTAHHGRNDPTEETFVYQCQGSNVGEMGALRSGNGHVTGGVPFVAHALTSEDGSGRGVPLAVVPFDERVITSPGNRSNPQPGDPACTLNPAGLQAIAGSMTVRRLMPVECLRLQGLPDDWLDDCGLSDSAKYRVIGNSVAVPVLEWIGRRMLDAMVRGG